MAATSVLASTPALEKQCEKVGLSDEWTKAMIAAQVDTLSKVSYAVSLPGTPATDTNIEDFAGKLRPGVALSLGDNAALKRLVFEAQTLCIAELRSSVQVGEDAPRKLPAAERALRIEQQAARLKGLPLAKGAWQCAHSLYDRFAHMRETEELRFVPPDECITRDQELAGSKAPKSVQLDASKSGLIVKDEEITNTMNITSDHELYLSFMRRALAMDLVGLASFDVMQKWIERLFDVMNQDPPPNFSRVSRAQVLRADRQVFVELARRANGGLKALADGSLPLDAEFRNLPGNTEIMYFLLPTPEKGKGKGKGKGDKRKHSGDGDEGGDKKKAKTTRDPVPKELQGCHSRTPKNKPICFNYNLGKCKKGKACKFEHVCCRPNCYGKHPFSQCPKANEAADATLWLSLFLHRPQMMSIFLVLPLTVLRCLLILMCKARLATRHPEAFRHLAIPCQHVHVSTATTTNRVPPEAVVAFYDAVGTAILGFLRFPPLAPGPTPLHLAQVAAGLQPRRSHLCLVPEFKCIANVRLPELPPLQDGKLKHELVVGDVCVPAGSKHLLPGSQRGKDGQGASAAVGGAYAMGGCVGVRKNASMFPVFTRALVRFLRHQIPDARFSCVAIFCDMLQGMHKDMCNQEGTLNYGVALSDFSEGFVWAHDPAGKVHKYTPSGKLPGVLHDIAKAPVRFDARKFHCVMPWHGQRVVVIGYTPQRGCALSAKEVRYLLSLGFPLPWVDTPSPTVPPVHDAPVEQRLENVADSGPVHSKLPCASAAACDTHLYTFGVYHSEAEFVRKAVQVGHPRSLYGSLPQAMEECIDALLVMPEASVVTKRAAWLAHWTARAKAIQENPDPDWHIQDPAMRAILGRKRLQLLDEILLSEGYGDCTLARDMHHGFDLVGVAPPSGVLPGKVTPASLEPEALSANACRANDALRASLRSCGDLELDEKLWEKTLLEVEQGWLQGPLEWSDLGPGEIASPRFPLLQNGKVRPIDDYSRSGVNSCVTTLEQPTVDTADVAAAMFSKLSNGLVRKGRSGALLGRSYDLTSAYRQLCVSRESSRFAIVAVFCPKDGKSYLFRQPCLPFGSRASVNGFIRCSRCIQWIALRCLLVPLTSYYDDFISASTCTLAANTDTTMAMLFRLLGWQYDEVGPKADVFSDRVEALGVAFDLSETCSGVVIVDNTLRRKDALDSLVSEALARGTLNHSQSLEMRGKLAFADAQVLGHSGKFALKLLSAHTHAIPFKTRIADDLSRALKYLRQRIVEGSPRRVLPTAKDTWFLFTDACFHDAGDGGLGGVLVSSLGSVKSWYCLPLSADDIQPLISHTARTGIGELETMATLLGIQLWRGHLRSTNVVAFNDNEGAKFALVKGYSKSMSVTRICHVCATVCETDMIMPWFCRVPSASNIADPPSRSMSCDALPETFKLPCDQVRRAYLSLRGRVCSMLS
ncbi:ubiad1 [Symbiodinium natans]|uniref:Ubiad1 protein n=1 Tax=Symbiodinium natans TaxID=878477 RepID=A0A812SS35_9DINO|nr:ubiad1 [Symbiodinium natans]